MDGDIEEGGVKSSDVDDAALSSAPPAAASNLAEQATPRPWYVGKNKERGLFWIDSDHAPAEGIADLYQRFGNELLAKANSEANAALIVAAVNDYEPLKEALRASNDLINRAQHILEKHLYPDSSGDAEETVSALLELLDGPHQREVQKATRAALALAETKT